MEKTTGGLTNKTFLADADDFTILGFKSIIQPNIIERNQIHDSIIIEAIKTDAYLKRIYKELYDLHSNAIPKVIQVSPTEFKATFDDDFNELIEKIHLQINIRIEEIISFYKR